MSMNKTKILMILNPILGLLVISQALSGFFADRLPHEAFEIIHEGGGSLLVIGVCLHVALNWSWLKAVFFQKKA